MTPARRQNGVALDLLAAGRALAWLCCLLAVTSFSPLPLTNAFSPWLWPTLPAGGGDSRAPLDEDDDDGAEHCKEANPEQPQRLHRQRRGQRATAATSALAHLPHPHRAAAGYHPPACTPFARGAHFPIRC
jgi:hypothetical protein